MYIELEDSAAMAADSASIGGDFAAMTANWIWSPIGEKWQ